MYRISVAGHLCVDLKPELGPNARFAPGKLFNVGPLTAILGGCVPNTGLALRDLGADPELQSVVGDDALASLVHELLSGVPCRLVTVPGASTSYSIVLEPGGADRTFWHHTGSNDRFDPRDVSIDTDLLHVGYPSLLPAVCGDEGISLSELFAAARGQGVTTSLDLADTDPDSPAGQVDWGTFFARILPRVDIISPSVDDLTSAFRDSREPSLDLAREYAEWLIEQGVAVAMVTAGRHGVTLRSGHEARLKHGGRVLAAQAGQWADAELSVEAQPLIGQATSTGAGDAATAGLLFGLINQWGPTRAIAAARAAAVSRMTGTRITP